MSCCELQTISMTIGGEELVAGDHVQTSTVLASSGVSYTRGDLLVISALNVATLATDPGTWDVICAVNMSATQSVSHSASGLGFGVYNQGEYNIKAVKLGGVVLTPAQYQTAMAVGTKRNIELRIPA
jgi:hypothetical protein